MPRLFRYVRFVFLYFTFNLCWIPFSNAQYKFADNLRLNLGGQYGYSLPEYSFIGYLTDSYVSSFSVAAIKESSGESPWESLFNYPESGVSFFYSSLGNDAVFGKSYALNYFFKLKFLEAQKSRAYTRIGIGMGYITKKFDLEHNYMNLAIGSHFNVHFTTKLGWEYKWSEKIQINTGLSFDHYSNANTQDPNRGLNLFTGEIGVSYLLGDQKEYLDIAFDSIENKHDFTIFVAAGGKQPRSFEDKHYFTSSVSVSYNHHINRVIQLGVGADVFYDSYAKPYVVSQSTEYKISDSFQTGVHISQQFIYNRFRIIIQEGIYIGLANKVIPKLMYNRAVVQYEITDLWNVRIAMKSHLHILDFPEFGIGVKL